MYKILVPIDFSACAETAAESALVMAQKMGASVTFMHLMTTAMDWVELSLAEEKNFPEVREQISFTKSELDKWNEKAKAKGVISDQFMMFAQDPKEITDHAVKHNYDLIIMGSHGASGVSGAVFGSTAQYIVRHAMTPVLVLKEAIGTSIPRQIIFACNFTDDVDAAFEKVVALAYRLGSYIKLVYVNHPESFQTTRQTMSKAKDFLQKCSGVHCDLQIYNADDVENGILQFSEDNQTDVIALVTHGRKGMSRVFNPSLTEKLVNRSALPVLSLNFNGHGSDRPD